MRDSEQGYKGYILNMVHAGKCQIWQMGVKINTLDSLGSAKYYIDTELLVEVDEMKEKLNSLSIKSKWGKQGNSERKNEILAHCKEFDLFFVENSYTHIDSFLAKERVFEIREFYQRYHTDVDSFVLHKECIEIKLSYTVKCLREPTNPKMDFKREYSEFLYFSHNNELSKIVYLMIRENSNCVVEL